MDFGGYIQIYFQTGLAIAEFWSYPHDLNLCLAVWCLAFTFVGLVLVLLDLIKSRHMVGLGLYCLTLALVNISKRKSVK